MGDGELTCLIPGPSEELARRPDGVRWCFGCRKHLPHDLVVLGDEQPSWYEPVAVTVCASCGRDRTRFPGRG